MLSTTSTYSFFAVCSNFGAQFNFNSIEYRRRHAKPSTKSYKEMRRNPRRKIKLERYESKFAYAHYIISIRNIPMTMTGKFGNVCCFCHVVTFRLWLTLKMLKYHIVDVALKSISIDILCTR